MKRRTLLAMLSALVLLSACETGPSSRPCPRVTEFPKDLQITAAGEIQGRPAISRMMDNMAVDRAFNRAICP